MTDETTTQDTENAGGDAARSALGSNLEVPKVKAPRAKKAEGMPERTWIILEDSDDIPPGGLFLGHNGDSFLLTTGEPALVPTKVLGILDAAITTVPIIDPATRRVSGYRDRMKYAYRRVEAPAEVE